MPIWNWKAARAKLLLPVAVCTSSLLCLGVSWSAPSADPAGDSGREVTRYFAINLQSTQEPSVFNDADALARFPALRLYVARTDKDAQKWYRWRLGFFTDEAAARTTLDEIRRQFPLAWLARVSREELMTAGRPSAGSPESPVELLSITETLNRLQRASIGNENSGANSGDSQNAAAGTYVLVLQSSRTEITASSLTPHTAYAPHQLLKSRIRKAGEVWHRLGLGRFVEESGARSKLSEIRHVHPGAWLASSQQSNAWIPVGAASPMPTSLLNLDTPADTTNDTTLAIQPAPSPDYDANAPLGPVAQVTVPGTLEPVDEASTPPSPPSTPPRQLLLYAVIVNQQNFGISRVLRDASGRFFLHQGDFALWGLLPPSGEAVIFNTQPFFHPESLPGYRIDVDDSTLTLRLTFAADAFAGTTVGGRRGPPTPVTPSYGGFFNYDLLALHTVRALSPDETRADGVFELGAFSPWGVAITDFLGQRLISENTGDDENPRAVRLQSNFRSDWPERALTLELGDNIGRSGIWGRPVRFGGVQWGKNFATQPNFVTFPLPSVSGEATLPSTAELYINDALRQSQRVTPGPFEIVELPVVSGGGEAQLVIRDLLGREQLVSVPFYTSNALLKEELSDFGVELGLVREDFGIASNEYGRLLAVATGAYGISNRLTVEGRMEVLEDQRTLGAGASLVLPYPSIITVAVAGSHSERGTGQLAVFNFERRRIPGTSFVVQAQYATRDFTQLGLQQGQLPTRLRINANLGLPQWGRGASSFSYALQDDWNNTRRELVAGFYSLPVSRHGVISAFATRSLSDPKTLSFGLTFVQRFGELDTAVLSYNSNDGADDGSLQVQRSLPRGEGIGYRLQLDGFGNSDRREAQGFWRTNTGTYGMGISHVSGTRTFRASADGGIAFQAGSVKLMRPLDNSFATVEVGDYENVDVFLNNQLVATTDADGIAWIPGLLDYQDNVVGIDVLDLPLDAEVATDELHLVPYFRSGVTAEFPVRPSNGALLTLILDDGDVLPAGSVVTVEDNDTRFPVALRGEVYITGIARVSQASAFWRNQSCRFEITIPQDAGPVPRIGPILCAGVQR